MRRLSTLLAAGAAVAATLAVTVAAGLTSAAVAASPLPADHAAKGYIGLCNEAGQNVTGGSIDTRPLIWKAVASSPPPSSYRGRGQNAVLGIFQPRAGTVPAEWGGAPLTAASYYTKATAVAQATYADQSLRSVIRRYPPQVDGLYVLRMYFGRAGYGNYTATYPTTTIQVTGTTWRVVQGGTVDCAAAHGVSNEQLTGVADRNATTARTSHSSQRTVESVRAHVISMPARRVASATPSGTARSDAGPTSSIDASPVSVHRSVSLSWVVWVLIGIVVALVAALGAVIRTRRAGPSEQ